MGRLLDGPVLSTGEREERQRTQATSMERAERRRRERSLDLPAAYQSRSGRARLVACPLLAPRSDRYLGRGGPRRDRRSPRGAAPGSLLTTRGPASRRAVARGPLLETQGARPAVHSLVQRRPTRRSEWAAPRGQAMWRRTCRLQHNQRFAVPAADAQPAWRKAPSDHTRLLELCALQHVRKVSKSNTVRVDGRVLDIPAAKGSSLRSHAGKTVIVKHLLSGDYRVHLEGACIAWHQGERPKTLRVARVPCWASANASDRNPTGSEPTENVTISTRSDTFTVLTRGDISLCYDKSFVQP